MVIACLKHRSRYTFGFLSFGIVYGCYNALLKTLLDTEMKKILLIIIILFSIGSIGGVFLAGLNMYTRSTTPAEEPQQTQQGNSPVEQQ